MRGTRETHEDGATAVEYALMVTLIAMVIIASVTLIGIQLTSLFADAAALV